MSPNGLRMQTDVGSARLLHATQTNDGSHWSTSLSTVRSGEEEGSWGFLEATDLGLVHPTVVASLHLSNLACLFRILDSSGPLLLRGRGGRGLSYGGHLCGGWGRR